MVGEIVVSQDLAQVLLLGSFFCWLAVVAVSVVVGIVVSALD